MIDEEMLEKTQKMVNKIESQVVHVLSNYNDKLDLKHKLTDLVLEWFYKDWANEQEAR